MKIQVEATPPGGGRLPLEPTIGDLKRFLSRLVWRVDHGHIPVQKANCLGQLCNTIIGAIRDHELEQRLTQLEADQASGGTLLRAERTLLISVSGEPDQEEAD